MLAKQQGPYYDLSVFVKACSAKRKIVFVRRAPRADAKSYFGLETEKRILGFLSQGEFVEIEHENTNTLDHDPDKGVVFDAYTFKIGLKFVYFAFYKRSNGTWVIKSFHPPQVGEKSPPLTHTPFTILGENKK